MTKLQPGEFKPLAQYIYSICAVSLDESKSYLMEGRLSAIAEDTASGSFTALVSRAKADFSRTIERRIIDAITTNETFFFRDNSPFDLLREKLIPELIERRKRAGPVRIWSAASSTGQEIYSIAILLKELLGDPDRYGVRLLGTDISNDAVARASRGIYTATEVSRGLPVSLRDKYFTQARDGWQIRDEIRAMASFKRLNLMDDFSALGRFDIVFCRNVAIYFTDQDRASLFRRIERNMEPDGALVVGTMESLSGACPQFESKRHGRAVFYQSKAAASMMAAR